MSRRNRVSLLQTISEMRYVIAVITLGALAGCTPDPNASFKVYPVHGKISWKDGRALPDKLGISLNSMGPQNLQSIGTVQKDGKFSNLLFMGYGGDGRTGAIPGKHRVVLQVRLPMGEEAAGMTAAQREEMAAQVRMYAPYSTVDKSKLEVEVGPKDQELLIVLE